jgi:hypothetical protein
VHVPIDRKSLGPVEFLVVAFPGSQFKGEIVPALRDLVESGTIRILDIAFVMKGEDGTVTTMELTDLGGEELVAFTQLDNQDLEALVNDEDLQLAAEELEPGDSAALLVWEDTWAAPLANAILNAGGEVLALERVPREAVDEVLDAIGVG